MRYRQFGRTGWQVSETGFGAGQTCGKWGKVAVAAPVRMLLHALERGINLVATADLYDSGHSEPVIIQTLARVAAPKTTAATFHATRAEAAMRQVWRTLPSAP